MAQAAGRSIRRRPTRRFAKTSFDPMVWSGTPTLSDARGRPPGTNGPTLDPPRHCPRGRAIGASSAYNKMARGPSARHRRWAAQRFEPETTAMLNSLDVEGSSAGHPRRRRHVGRRRFLGHGRAAQGRGLRRRRRHAAALRPWRRDPSQGRLLRRPGHPRRARGGRAHRHSALRARLREPLQGGGDRPLRRELRGGRDAGAVHRLQPVDQVPRPAGDRARARRRGAGDRPLRRLAAARRAAAARSTARARRSATRAISCSPPRASSSTCCASRSAT